MGGEIIAEKFALLKTRGSNGVSSTHFVEDILLGQRAVVKVSDKLGDLGFDYLKTFNLVSESGIPGLLMPLEGGILEEEAGYYLVFPELGEPSLENYLRMGAPITCGDVLGMGRQILEILVSLHDSGFCHLFLNTRNVFYRPRGEVTLKDPALKLEFFHALMELVDAPDFSYFSPEVMDGFLPGSGMDLYALGRLMERCLAGAADAGGSPDEPAARWLAERCRAAGGDDSPSSAADILLDLDRLQAELKKAGEADTVASRGNDAGPQGSVAKSTLSREHRRPRGRGTGGTRKAGTAIAAVMIMILAGGAAFAFLIATVGGRAPASGRGGGSLAGEGISREAFLDLEQGKEAVAGAGGNGDTGGVQEAAKVEAVREEEKSPGEPAAAKPQEAGGTAPSAADPAAGHSPASPVAAFSLSAAEGQSPLQVYLDASASYDPDGSIVSYTWSCGGSGVSFYHVFESNIIPAVIPITLTVTDDGGHSAQATHCVTLY
jgi:hypothetical protein